MKCTQHTGYFIDGSQAKELGAILGDLTVIASSLRMDGLRTQADKLLDAHRFLTRQAMTVYLPIASPSLHDVEVDEPAAEKTAPWPAHIEAKLVCGHTTIHPNCDACRAWEANR